MTCARRKLLSRDQRQATILQGAATAFATKGFARDWHGGGSSGLRHYEGNRLPAFASKEELPGGFEHRADLQVFNCSMSQEIQSGAGPRLRLAVGRAARMRSALLLVHSCPRARRRIMPTTFAPA